MRGIAAALIGALLGAGEAAAQAEPTGLLTAQSPPPTDADQPVRLVGAERDWRFECLGAPKASLCRLSTAAQAGDRTAQLIVMVSREAGDAPAFFLHFPLGMLLSEDAALSVDGRPQGAHRVHTCQETGCMALLTPPQPLIAAFQRGQAAVFQQPDLSGETITFRFSLLGFTRALTRAQRRLQGRP